MSHFRFSPKSLVGFSTTACFLLFAPCFAAQQLVMLGTFHGSEMSAKNGEDWIAITDKQKKAVKLKVSTVTDSVIDEGKQKTGKMVSIPSGDAIFLVRDIPNVDSGPCITVLKKETQLWKKPATKLTLGKRNYIIDLKLKVGKRTKKDDTYTPAHCSVVVSDGSVSEIILDKDCVAELEGLEAPRLLWAGDIDKDGQLDLLMDGTTESNVATFMLFLSSKSGKGKLMNKAAEFTITGC